jgi:hypothetical protein
MLFFNNGHTANGALCVPREDRKRELTDGKSLRQANIGHLVMGYVLNSRESVKRIDRQGTHVSAPEPGPCSTSAASYHCLWRVRQSTREDSCPRVIPPAVGQPGGDGGCTECAIIPAPMTVKCGTDFRPACSCCCCIPGRLCSMMQPSVPWSGRAHMPHGC